jgi:hypothetical protein
MHNHTGSEILLTYNTKHCEQEIFSCEITDDEISVQDIKRFVQDFRVMSSVKIKR